VTFNSEDATAYVYDDPQIVFKVQASGALAATDEGQFAGLVIGTVNTYTGTAADALNSADITGTLDNLKILNKYDYPGNDYGNYCVAEVLIAKHEYRDPVVAT
jgi:hypothetical protein